MLAHAHMHVRGIEVIIGELMVPTFYSIYEREEILASISLYYEVTLIKLTLATDNDPSTFC